MAKSKGRDKPKKKRNKKRKQRADDQQAQVSSTMDRLIIALAEQLIEAKKHTAIGIADEKRLAKQVEGEMSRAAEWERRATMATRANDDALARESLVRKREHDAAAAVYRRMWAQQKRYVDKLKMALRAINNKVNKTKRRKDQIASQLRAVDACEKLAATSYGIERTLGLMDALAFATVGDEQHAAFSEELCPLCTARFPALEAALAAARAGRHEEAATLLADLDAQEP